MLLGQIDIHLWATVLYALGFAALGFAQYQLCRGCFSPSPRRSQALTGLIALKLSMGLIIGYLSGALVGWQRTDARAWFALTLVAPLALFVPVVFAAVLYLISGFLPRTSAAPDTLADYAGRIRIARFVAIAFFLIAFAGAYFE